MTSCFVENNRQVRLYDIRVIVDNFVEIGDFFEFCEKRMTFYSLFFSLKMKVK